MRVEEINKIYNGFSPEQRDMPREEFVKEMQEITSSKAMQSDLTKVMQAQHLGRSTKAEIDRVN